jgi:methanogenic corrinoid protein MtbC1
MNSYVSPTTLSQAFGVSSSTLKRWADKGMLVTERTPGGHRRFSISNAVEMSRTQRIPMRNPSILGLPPLLNYQATEGQKLPHDLLLESLEQNAFSNSRDIILGLFIGGMPLLDLFQEVIVPVLAQIGMEWTDGPQAIAKEHASSQLVIESLAILQTLLPKTPETIFAVGGSPSGDPYRIPTAMVSLVLQNIGLRSINLGPDLPIDSLLHFCKKEKPKLAWLSLTSKEPLPKLKKKVHVLAEKLHETGTVLAIGGRQSRNLLKKPIPNVVLFSSLEPFSQFCTGLGLLSKV